MAVTMPKIQITFQQRATSLMQRSARGICALIIRDNTSQDFTVKQYADLAEAQKDKALYTEDNCQAICDMLSFAPYKAHVVRIDTAEGTTSPAKAGAGEITAADAKKKLGSVTAGDVGKYLVTVSTPESWTVVEANAKTNGDQEIVADDASPTGTQIKVSEAKKKLSSVTAGDVGKWLHHVAASTSYRVDAKTSDGALKIIADTVTTAGGQIADALAEIRGLAKSCWIAIAGQNTEDGAALAAWVKTQAAAGRSYKAVLYKATPPDEMHIVNFANDSVVFADERGKQGGVAYLPSLLAILAVCNVERGCTNYHCANLKRVQEVADNDTAIGEGKLILINDEDNKVRVAQGINSMTTTDGLTKTEDMKFVETVECMDMIRDDISAVFRNEYLGNYRNNRDNQMLFISSVNASYFAQLAQEQILDSAYANALRIDVEAQRQAWVASGTAEAAQWDDDKVKANAFKRTVFLAGNIKILGSMTDLVLPITMA